MLAHHFLHYYSRRCRRTVSELASVVNPTYESVEVQDLENLPIILEESMEYASK